MAVTQPNLTPYKQEAEEAFQEIMNLLVNKYRIDELDTLNDPPAYTKNMVECYIKNTNKIKNALTELFLNQGCYDF